jgi:hypothetical protein
MSSLHQTLVQDQLQQGAVPSFLDENSFDKFIETVTANQAMLHDDDDGLVGGAAS